MLTARLRRARRVWSDSDRAELSGQPDPGSSPWTMDRFELLERASRYRELAATVLDEQAGRALFDLAEKYEAMAGGDKALPDADL